MAFLPTDLSNGLFWYKFDAGVTSSGSNVQAITDFFGNGYDMGLANPNNKVRLVPNALNGYPAIASQNNPNGYGVLLTSGNIPALTSATILLVVKRTSIDATINGGVTDLLKSNGNFLINSLAPLDPLSFVVEATDSSDRVFLPTANDVFYTILVRLNGTNIFGAINNGADWTQSVYGTPSAAPLAMLGFGDKQIVEAIGYSDFKFSNDLALLRYYLQQKYNHYTWTGGIPSGFGDTQANITFPGLPEKVVGDADFSPGATSNSPAAISYSSSNTAVATIVSGNIHIVGAGTATITANQSATTGFTSATAQTQTLTVKQVAVITFPTLPQATVGQPEITPGATSTSTAPITYTSSDPAVAKILNGKIQIVGPGTATITASQGATVGYAAAVSVSRTITVVSQTVQNNAPQKPAGYWFMDGVDLYATWGIMINEGTASWLAMPARKASTTHDWMDSDGIDVDVSRVFLKERKGVLEMAIRTTSEADFWTKYRGFYANLLQPGLRRLEFKSHGNRSYFVYYEDNPTYRQVVPLRGEPGDRHIVHRFSITLIEPEPSRIADNVFIVDDSGRFLIS